jgi:glycosyltransferase involved in cell wall biosynthesis
LLASIAVRLAKTGRCVATQHFLQPNRSTHRGLKAMVSKAMHHWVDSGVDRFIAISKASAQGMLDRKEVPPQKVKVVLNGMAAPDIAALKDPKTLRDELGVASDAPLVVCVARLEPEKDITTLLKAMKQVTAAIPSATCWIAGDGTVASEIAAQVRQLGLEKTVNLLGFREDALSLINAADVFVLPSLAEPFGLVLLEAMALSKPVIATRAGGPVEIVEHDRTGILIKPSEENEMSQAIQRLLGDAALRESMGQQGRDRFDRRFSAQAMARATIAVYQEALASETVDPAVAAMAIQQAK